MIAMILKLGLSYKLKFPNDNIVSLGWEQLYVFASIVSKNKNYV
jgi:hypothetical protein